VKIFSEFRYEYRESFDARMDETGRIVLTDANGLRALEFTYEGPTNDEHRITSAIDEKISEAMLTASTPTAYEKEETA
jgi:hypothetical protein